MSFPKVKKTTGRFPETSRDRELVAFQGIETT